MDQTLPTTLATYVYLLHRAGIDAIDGAVAAACARADGGDSAGGDALVAGVSAHLDATVAEALAALYGADRVQSFGGEHPDREARVAALRRALFGIGLPWLARLAHRDAAGLADRWVIVEGFAETVRILDPNPWDDKDEEQDLPVAEFVVRWELGGLGFAAVRG